MIPLIDLYKAPTPNGDKASCTLEALAIPYFAKNAKTTLQT